MLKIEGLFLRKGAFSLRNISFEVSRRDYFVVLGKSGGGKTMLLECIAGLQPRHRGKITIAGCDVTSDAPEKRNIGFVFQHFALFPHLNVERNIRYAGRFRQSNRGDDKSFDELISFLGVAHLLQRGVRDLSAGEQQRVAIARALFGNPQLVLLDEPLGALDPATRELIVPKLMELPARFGIPVIQVTHDFDIARKLATRMAVIIDGTLRCIGSPDDIFNNSHDKEVAAFLDASQTGAAGKGRAL